MGAVSNRQAFTLVEILIALGLIGVLGVGIASLLQQNQRGITTATTQAGLNEIRAATLTIVRDRVHCASNILARSPVNVNGSTPLDIRNVVNTNQVSNGLRYEPKLEELQLINSIVRAYVGVITLDATSTGNLETRRFGVQDLSAEIPIVLRLDAANRIAECSLDSTQYTDSGVQELLCRFTRPDPRCRTAQNCIDNNGVVWPVANGYICRVPNMDPRATNDDDYISNSEAESFLKVNNNQYGRPFISYCPNGWAQYRNYSKTVTTQYIHNTCHSGSGSFEIPGHAFADVTYNPPLPKKVTRKSGSMPYCSSWQADAYPLVRAVGCY